MNKDEKEYPLKYTEFSPRTNAEYDGDPQGDYVMAEDVNQLQDAIHRIEEYLGIEGQQGESLTQRIENIEDIGTIKVPSSLFLQGSGYEGNLENTIAILSMYSLVATSTIDSNTTELFQRLKEKKVSPFGTIQNQESLKEFQSELGEWRDIGAEGVLLYQLGDLDQTREEENQRIRSIYEQGMKVIIHSNHWSKLLSSEKEDKYNPKAVELEYSSDSILLINNFAIYERQYYGEAVRNKVEPFLQKRVKYQTPLMANAYAANQKDYEYSQMYGLIYSLDYIYNGSIQGMGLNEASVVYDFPTYIGKWKETEPIVFSSDTQEERIIRGGKMAIRKDKSIDFIGFRLNSRNIKFIKETIPGTSIKDGSLPPSKLSTYDVDRIIKLFNKNSTIKIDPKVIETSEGGTLPVNIPASHLKENVIEAVNKKIDSYSSEKSHIISDAIKNLNANKLVGDIAKGPMQKNVISSINNSDEKIDIEEASINNLFSEAIQTDIVNAESGTMTNVNVQQSITTNKINVGNLVDAKNGEFQYLHAVILEADSLEAKEIHADKITGDNMEAIVLEAVEANINSGKFNDIVTVALEAETIKTEVIEAVNAMVGEAVIDGALIRDGSIVDAQIVSLDVNKLTAGTIDTGKVTISSEEGHLVIKSENIKLYDGTSFDQTRNLRVQIGNVSDVLGGDEQYGLIVMGPDGQTVLYDHTGVYNEGLHENAVSNEKLQDESVDGRTIQAYSIQADHIVSDAITTRAIAAGAVTTNEIEAGTITAGSAIIADAAIGSAQISEINGSKITANSISGKKIEANSITTDKLQVGDMRNLIKNGFDSFEQFPENESIGIKISGAESSKVEKNHAYSGNQSLLVMGNNSKNILQLAYNDFEILPRLSPLKEYIFSAYAITESNNNPAVSVGVQLTYKNGSKEEFWAEDERLSANSASRIYRKIQTPKEFNQANLLLRTSSSNVEIWFDCLMFEEVEGEAEEPGWWSPSEVTTIDGSSIQTGTVDASRIQIGKGTLFGNGDVITISDDGILAESDSGYAELGSKGLEIEGGAFSLKNENKVRIDGDGLAIASKKNHIKINPDNGIEITKEKDGDVQFKTDTDGNVYVKGRIEVTSSDSVYTKEEVDESVKDVSDTIDKLPEYVQSRLENLVTNGTGMLGDNTNFPNFTFDGKDRVIGKGSFKKKTSGGTGAGIEETLPIDTRNVYKLDYYAKTSTGQSRSYACIVPYDIDGLRISARMVGGNLKRYDDSNKIYTLARPLSVGDTKIYLNTVEGWPKETEKNRLHHNGFILWDYHNSFGYRYADKTYSRWAKASAYTADKVNEEENSITLKAPFPYEYTETEDGVFPIGHKISPTRDGGTYVYPKEHKNRILKNEWEKIESLILGDELAIIDATASIRLNFLLNREIEGGDTTWINGLSLTDYSSFSSLEGTIKEIDENINNIDDSIEDIKENVDKLGKQSSISLSSKIGYSSWTKKDSNSIYLSGMTKDGLTENEKPADVNGSLRDWETGEKKEVVKQHIDVTSAPQTSGYILYDTGTTQAWFIWYSPTESNWLSYNKKYRDSSKVVTFDEDKYIIGELDLT